MKKSKWLDKFENGTSLQENPNNSVVKLPPNYVGLGYDTSSRKFSPAWGGQFQKGGKLIPVSPMEQITGETSTISPTVPYLKTKDPVEFYQSWIQSPEYARRQLLTGYSPSAEDESLAVPSAALSRQTRLESLQNIDPITYSTRQPSESRPGVYGIASTVNINPLDYIDTNRGMVEAHELAHIAGAMESEGTTRPGVMSAKEQEIFKKSMLPIKEPVLTGAQGSKEREASKRALEDFEHSKKPKELKADLDALRFTMYDKGIYDITKGKKFTEADFEKAKQSLGKDRVFKRLENRVGKKNFVNLMNTIAKADGEEELPLAMGGMSIPGSVGFTYARTGSTPSNGKYAKKTMASAQSGITSPLLMMGKILSYIMPDEETSESIAIEKKAPTKGLTNELLQRQAYKESTFNPSAVSPAGYKGLTQIGEEVIADYSKKKGGKKLDPFNPQDAVELQKFAMDDLYNASFINKPNQSDSVRIAKTLAAYNWGRGNLYDYLGEQKKKGVDIYNSYDWLQDLPKETSDYVNKILLQEDPSFNKNYKKASTNPKYEEVTSLYDQKKFGGDIPSAQKGKNDVEKISINDPRYPEMYKNRQVGLSYDDAISLPDLPEVVITAPRSYTMDSLRDFTSAALYGVPENLMKLEQVPTAALAETIAMLTGKPYNFSNVNPNFGQFGSNQRDLSILGYENPQGFLQNAANIGLSAIDPALVTGGASMLRKPLQKKLAKSFSKNFKSEINWNKWNKEIPKNKPLLQEYNAIEQQTKANGTWMKNPDGTNFDGTPEEFIQQNSSNFKKAYPDGAFTTYKGVGAQGRMDNLRDPDGEWTRPFFAGDKNIADVFTSQYHTSKSPIISHNNKKFNPDANPEVHKFIISKSPNSLRVDANSGHWAGFEIPENSIPGLGTRTGTPELQRYVRDKGLDYITIDNLFEGGGGAAKGTVHIINPRLNNIPKSAIGNSGMFDMTNPNIYKGVVPAGIATALSIDQQKNGGITKDNRGYWNPDNWGKPVEINSNMITMQGVYEPLLGVSDTGDTKLMKPGKNYKFKGKKVTEFPVAKLGINQLDAQPMKKLNQLLNFTNNPDKDNWLDKYN